MEKQLGILNVKQLEHRESQREYEQLDSYEFVLFSDFSCHKFKFITYVCKHTVSDELDINVTLKVSWWRRKEKLYLRLEKELK